MVRFSRVWRAVLCMGHPQVRWSLQLMTQNGGIPAQFQGNREGQRSLTTKSDGMCNFVEPHASLRQPLLIPEATNGCGSAKLWRPCTPAMVAGLTDHVWSLKEVLFFRVPPWAQPQTA